MMKVLEKEYRLPDPPPPTHTHEIGFWRLEDPFYLYARLQTGRIMLWRPSVVRRPSEFVRAITPNPLCRFEQYFTRLLPWT
jgi:hypothetical protein